MLDTMVAPRPGCQPLPGIATFLAGLPHRVATDGFYIPSPGVATSASPTFTFPSHLGSLPGSLDHTCPPPSTPRGLEVAATMSKMCQRVADDGFYIPSPDVCGSDVGATFTFDDLTPSLVVCDLDHKMPPITPRGREVALMLTNMGRRMCHDELDVASSLVRDLDVSRSDDVSMSSIFSFSEADVTALLTSLPTCDVDDVNALTSQEVLRDHRYNREPLPSPPVLPVWCGVAEPADRKQNNVSFRKNILTTLAPIPRCHSAVMLNQSSDRDDGDVTASVPEYVTGPAETAKRARRACRRPHRYVDPDSEADDVTPAPPIPPHSTRRAPTRQNSSKRRRHTPLNTSPSPVSIPPPTPTTLHLAGANFTKTATQAPQPRGGRNRKSLPCPMCSRTFTSSFSLRQHTNTHTGARPYVCDICTKDFAQVTTLRTHRRLHTGERPYQCRHCARAYSDYSSWTKHERTHTGARPYTCTGCGASFTQSGNLKRHQGACRG